MHYNGDLLDLNLFPLISAGSIVVAFGLFLLIAINYFSLKNAVTAPTAISYKTVLA